MVARLSPPEQDHWLDLAIKEGWSVHALRTAIREHRLLSAPFGDDAGKRTVFRQPEASAGIPPRPPDAHARACVIEGAERHVVDLKAS